jgi:hypothetical protein
VASPVTDREKLCSDGMGIGGGRPAQGDQRVRRAPTQRLRHDSFQNFHRFFRWFPARTAPASRNRSNKQHPTAQSRESTGNPPNHRPASRARSKSDGAQRPKGPHARPRRHAAIRGARLLLNLSEPNSAVRVSRLEMDRMDTVLFNRKIGEFRLTATSWVNSIEIAAGKDTRAYFPLAHRRARSISPFLMARKDMIRSARSPRRFAAAFGKPGMWGERQALELN